MRSLEMRSPLGVRWWLSVVRYVVNRCLIKHMHNMNGPLIISNPKKCDCGYKVLVARSLYCGWMCGSISFNMFLNVSVTHLNLTILPPQFGALELAARIGCSNSYAFLLFPKQSLRLRGS